jgi:hypothetical protein
LAFLLLPFQNGLRLESQVYELRTHKGALRVVSLVVCERHARIERHKHGERGRNASYGSTESRHIGQEKQKTRNSLLPRPHALREDVRFGVLGTNKGAAVGTDSKDVLEGEPVPCTVSERCVTRRPTLHSRLSFLNLNAQHQVHTKDLVLDS